MCMEKESKNLVKYPIDFYDKNNALRTGMTDDESKNEEGIYVLYNGERIFVKNENIRNRMVQNNGSISIN